MAENEEAEREQAKKLDKMKHKLNMIRGTNSALVSEVEGFGQHLELTLPRLEHFMVFLVELGVITEDQMLDEAIKWEHNLKEQIVPLVREMRVKAKEIGDRIRRQAEAEQREAAKTKGVQVNGTTPDGKKASLILPAGTRLDPVEEGSKLEAPQSAGETED